MKPRGALPWLASVVMHACLLLIPVGVFLAPAAGTRPPLDVTFTDFRPARPGAARVDRTAAPIVAPGVAPGSEAQRGPAFRTSAGVTGVSSTLPADVLSPDANRASAATDPALPWEGAAAASSGTPPVGGQGASTSQTAVSTAATSPTIGWEGATRALIRRRDPRFPSVLSASGQEVEGEARITVAPSGAVVRVEITRSTGYIEIDASVEAALRDYLFSRVDGRVDALGTVRFRFRLEKTD